MKTQPGVSTQLIQVVATTDGEVVDVDRDGDNGLVSQTNDEIRWYENLAGHTIDASCCTI
jgi:hypothetical protein